MDEPSSSALLGANLIFIFSQPCAGSTMLARILGGHSKIHTVSEPWIMLTPFFPLRPEGYGSDLFCQGAKAIPLKRALELFTEELPDGEEAYYESVRRMGSYLYESIRQKTGKQLFLDKTPQYFHVIAEICRTFPRAKFLFLLRNPLAVLSSIVNTRTQLDARGLRDFECDLLTAPQALVNAINELSGRCHVLQYERLVANPACELQRVCDWLGIEFESQIIEYGQSALPPFAMGDPTNVYRHERPVMSHVDGWVDRLEDAQLWRWSRDYLTCLGPELLAQMGYCYDDLLSIIERQTPRAATLLTRHFRSIAAFETSISGSSSGTCWHDANVPGGDMGPGWSPN